MGKVQNYHKAVTVKFTGRLHNGNFSITNLQYFILASAISLARSQSISGFFYRPLIFPQHANNSSLRKMLSLKSEVRLLAQAPQPSLPWDYEYIYSLNIFFGWSQFGSVKLFCRKFQSRNNRHSFSYA